MISKNVVTPLRIANEAFMVAATIERCPRQMMLRELVMNAVEAAVRAVDSPNLVRIDGVEIDGTPKLRIWNTGRGLSSSELLQISDLSSSLFKTVSLKDNFGMGAKAASLASNTEGLRYRSCRNGTVSQILLGARDGIYGRLLQADPENGSQVGEVIDVTKAALAEERDLTHDWTEVVLFGNGSQQNTTVDPYAGDPVMHRDWIVQTLGQRFVYLPAGVEIIIEPSASGGSAGETFIPPLRPRSFDRMESVNVGDDILIHYGYRAADSELPPPRVDVIGVGAVVYDGEVYALVNSRRWLLEAPSYGFSFAAKRCSVVVELPRHFNAQPEQYRQFLRFNDGDQHQVQLADFGDLVRLNIPHWLKRIIDDLLPDQNDYLAEIRDELLQLIAELGIQDLLRGKGRSVREQERRDESDESVSSSDTSDLQTPTVPPAEVRPKPPEFIPIEDETDIVEKALGGRAARYYPATQQVFVNVRYAAFARIQAQLLEEFAPFADEETVKQLAKTTAEWAVIQRLARTLMHTLAKPRLGWNIDEVKSVQMPEAMSLVVDDVDPLLGAARHRMAVQLGLEPEAGTGQSGGHWSDPMAQRAAGDIAEAEAQLQRAMAGSARRLGPYYRQIGAIHLRQRNLEAARAWLEKGMAVDHEDPWCRNEYVTVLLADNDFEGAARVAEEALALATNNQSVFRRTQAKVEVRRGDFDSAREVLTRGAADDSENPWFHYDLAQLHLVKNDIEAAEAAIEEALQRSPAPSATLLRRRAEVEERKGETAKAQQFLSRAKAVDPSDPWIRYDLARSAAAAGRYDEAVDELEEAIRGRPAAEAHLQRLLSEVELKRGRRVASLAAANRACRADPTEPWCHYQLARVLLAAGDLDNAAQIASHAVSHARMQPSPHFYRLQAEIEGKRGNTSRAISFLEDGLQIAPQDPLLWLEVASQRMAMGNLDEADEAATTAGTLLPGAEKARALSQRAQIAFRRNNTDGANKFLEEAIRIAPNDPRSRVEAANQRLAAHDAEGALKKITEAILVSPVPRASLLCRAAEIEAICDNRLAADAYLKQAMALEPENPQPWSVLCKLLAEAGEHAEALKAAEKALEISTAGREIAPTKEKAAAAA